jgi:hypothetical protein
MVIASLAVARVGMRMNHLAVCVRRSIVEGVVRASANVRRAVALATTRARAYEMFNGTARLSFRMIIGNHVGVAATRAR